jgi:biopolymer transport protein ExbB
MNADPQSPPQSISSVYDMIWNGGPLMWPLAACSIIALAYVVERTIRLREGELGSRSYARSILDALTQRGTAGALERCAAEPRPLGRVLQAALQRAGKPVLEREKAVEDAGQREARKLSANLRPLVVIGMIAPLLGLLGTVYGIIQAFSEVAFRQGQGKPEQLAAGLSQALVTTAAGLTIAVPAQAAYFWLKSKVDRFVRRAEDSYDELDAALERLPREALESGGAS